MCAAEIGFLFVLERGSRSPKLRMRDTHRALTHALTNLVITFGLVQRGDDLPRFCLTTQKCDDETSPTTNLTHLHRQGPTGAAGPRQQFRSLLHR